MISYKARIKIYMLGQTNLTITDVHAFFTAFVQKIDLAKWEELGITVDVAAWALFPALVDVEHAENTKRAAVDNSTSDQEKYAAIQDTSEWAYRTFAGQIRNTSTVTIPN